MGNAMFPLGKMCMTRGVNDKVAEDLEFAKFVLSSLRRHARGDWGDSPPEDARENDYSVDKELRIFSKYEHEKGIIWIITEADRSSTMVLFPGEY